MSSFTKDGISAGMGTSMNIRAKATAESMAVTVILWVRETAAVREMAWTLGSDIIKHSFLLLENTLRSFVFPR
jgi:hypothetical protein